MKYPKKLQPGATIGLICPSSPITPEKEAGCRAVVEAMGYRVKMADNLTVKYGGFMAGAEEVRADWVNCMFADPEVDAILCACGGDTSSRILEYLDLDLIRANPKIFVGYSDVTNLNLVLNQQCGLVTFHGPMANSNMRERFDDETKESFFHALNAEESYEFRNPNGFAIKTLRTGSAERVSGVLTGGNLALLSASIGTPYEWDTKDKILFIEEINENTSRVERMFYQLRNSGKLAQCAGIILGQFTNCGNQYDESYTEIDSLADATRGLDIPIIYNVQSGHGQPMMTLPLGAECTIDLTCREKPRMFFAKPQR